MRDGGCVEAAYNSQDTVNVTGIPCTKRVSHTVYLTHGNSKGKARGRSRHKSIVVKE